MAHDDEWTRLAWQGIAFDTPADWCPGQLQGSFETGYLRVEDELNIRLELRWEPLGRRRAAASALVDNYLRLAHKKLGRKAPRPTIDRDREIRKLRPVDHEAFTWRGAFNAHSLVLVCPESRRGIHLRVFFTPGHELKRLTRRIFESVTTVAADGLTEWSAFDFGFRIARSWRLESSALRTGCLQLAFRDGRDQLEASRFSLAEIVLRKAPMDKWFARTFAKALRGFDYTLAEGTYGGHAALRCEGRSSRLSRPLGILRRRRHVTALAWHCGEADKLFTVRAVSDVGGEPRVAACADTIACHRQPEAADATRRREKVRH